MHRTASGKVKLQKFKSELPKASGSLTGDESDEEKADWEMTRSVDAVIKPKTTRLVDIKNSYLASSRDGNTVDPDPENLVPPALKNTIHREQLVGMRNVFNTFDSDSDGIVNPSDIGTLLRKLGLISSRRMIRCIVEVVDVNGDGEIDFGEFVTLMVQVKELSNSSEDESDDGDSEETPKERPKLTQDEKDAIALRQKAMTAFKQAVTIMAFKQMTGTPEEMRDQVLKVLSTDPSMRTEWELQRLLMWLEAAELEFIHQLPPTSESDVRVQVCRCLTIKRFVPGQAVVHVGDKGDCMFIVLSGQADVVEERRGKADGMPPELHVVVSLDVGKSFGEMAIVGEENDRDRAATVVAGGRDPLICGVLTRKDYRHFILKMRMEMMEPVVDMLMHHPTTANIQRSHLLKMGLVLLPVKFARHDVLCAEGTVPDRVIFLTKGAAEMTVTRPIVDKHSKQRHAATGAKKRTVRVSTLTVGAAVEMVADHIVLDDKEPSAFTLTASTACEGFVCSRNVAKRYLGKKAEAIRGIKKNMDAMNAFIASRVAAAEDIESSLTKLFASPRGLKKNERSSGSSTARDKGGPGKHPDYRQPAAFVPDALDLVAAEQSETLRRTHFLSRHPRREYPLHAPNPRMTNTYRSSALELAVKENEAIVVRPADERRSAVWQENDISVKDWTDDPYVQPRVRQVDRAPQMSEAYSDPLEFQEALQPEPQHQPVERLSQSTDAKRKQLAVALTSAALYAARDKAPGSPRSIAAVRTSRTSEYTKGVGTAGEQCAATARARLEYNRGGSGLPQLYPRDRTMPPPVHGPGSTKAGVLVPAVR